MLSGVFGQRGQHAAQRRHQGCDCDPRQWEEAQSTPLRRYKVGPRRAMAGELYSFIRSFIFEPALVGLDAVLH